MEVHGGSVLSASCGRDGLPRCGRREALRAVRERFRLHPVDAGDEDNGVRCAVGRRAQHRGFRDGRGAGRLVRGGAGGEGVATDGASPAAGRHVEAAVAVFGDVPVQLRVGGVSAADVTGFPDSTRFREAYAVLGVLRGFPAHARAEHDGGSAPPRRVDDVREPCVRDALPTQARPRPDGGGGRGRVSCRPDFQVGPVAGA